MEGRRHVAEDPGDAGCDERGSDDPGAYSSSGADVWQPDRVAARGGWVGGADVWAGRGESGDHGGSGVLGIGAEGVGGGRNSGGGGTGVWGSAFGDHQVGSSTSVRFSGNEHARASVSGGFVSGDYGAPG